MITGMERGFRGYKRWIDLIWRSTRRGMIRAIRPHR